MLRASRFLRVRQPKNTAPLFMMRYKKAQQYRDVGHGSPGDWGDDRLTDPRQYNARSVKGDLRATKAMTEFTDRMEMGGVAGTLPDPRRVEALRDFAAPTSSAEAAVDRRLEAQAIGLDERPLRRANSGRDLHVRGVSQPISQRAVSGVIAGDTDRRVRSALAIPILKNEMQQRKLARRVVEEPAEEDRAARLRDRLVTEHGIYNRKRMEAFMLDDESIFPKWVRELAPSMKDRVMYGGLGISDEEEWQRQNLLKLPREAREQEWVRLRAAKAYELGEERAVTPAELRAWRLGKRKHHALRRKREQQEANLRALALREPEQWETKLVGKIDYSARLALVARHVEANVKTNGKWPLDLDALESAKRRQAKDNARAEFLVAKPGRDFSVLHDRVSPALREAIKTVEREERPVKRISRRTYSFRLQAVKDGNQDEHGRNYHKVSKMQRTNVRSERSLDEFEASKALASTKFANGRGSKPPFISNVPRRYQPELKAFEAPRSAMFRRETDG